MPTSLKEARACSLWVRWRHGDAGVKFLKRKQAQGDRRRRPRHERLIIAMTLVVGVLWLVSYARVVLWGDGGSARDPARMIGLLDGSVVLRGANLGGEWPSNWRLEYGVGSVGPLRHAFVPLSYIRPGVNIVTVPLGSLLPLATAALFFLPAVRTGHRSRKNRCVDCGYPRDEQLERCPECGRLTSEPSPGIWLLAWRAYRWPLSCIAVNVAITLVAIEVMN